MSHLVFAFLLLGTVLYTKFGERTKTYHSLLIIPEAVLKNDHFALVFDPLQIVRADYQIGEIVPIGLDDKVFIEPEPGNRPMLYRYPFDWLDPACQSAASRRG
jgi:hypothetical protein